MFGAGGAKLRAAVFGELAAMVRGGVNIGEALAVAAEELHNARMARALEDVGHAVMQGRPLAAGLRQHEDLFSPLTIAMIEVGETSGRLAEALREVHDYHERDFELRHLLTRELAYPMVLFGAILFIPVIADFIRVWITATLAAAVGVTLKYLLWYTLILVMPVVIIGYTWRSLAQSQQSRRFADGLLLKIPVVGTMLRKLAVVRFCRALASLYSSGVLLGTAVQLAGQAAGNAVVQKDLTQGVGMIERGASLSDALAESSMLPPTARHMFRTGERTGDIDAMAHRVADYLEMEAETAIRQLAVSLTPAAVIIGGVIVALIVFKFYLGLYSF